MVSGWCDVAGMRQHCHRMPNPWLRLDQLGLEFIEPEIASEQDRGIVQGGLGTHQKQEADCDRDQFRASHSLIGRKAHLEFPGRYRCRHEILSESCATTLMLWCARMEN